MGVLEAAFLSIFGIALISFSSLFFIMWILYVFTALILGITFFVFWIIALIDCIKRDEKDFAIGGDNAKLIWILLLILVRGIAGVVYYLVIMRNASPGDRKIKKK